jgi:vesicle coat complex subunit
VTARAAVTGGWGLGVASSSCAAGETGGGSAYRILSAPIPSLPPPPQLDILVALVNERNVDAVLLELREYASEVDVEYVRRAVRTIGRCAIKLEAAAEKCIKVLLSLITTKVNYVVQEAVVVIKDIFRRYPNRYESIIGVLCSCLDTLDEPEAKAAMVWIIGEYADRIDNAAELLGSFTDSFHDETTGVQLALLTATVKLFLKRPSEAEELVQSVLSLATEHR